MHRTDVLDFTNVVHRVIRMRLEASDAVPTDQSGVSDRSVSRYRRIVAAVISAILGKGASVLVSAVTVPLTVRYLGAEGYGLWITISSAATMFFVMDIGIANTLTNLISESYAKEDKQSAVRYFTTAFWIVAGISSLLGLVGWLIWPYLNWPAILHVRDSELAKITSRAVAVTFAIFLVSLPTGLASKILGGYQETHTANLFSAAGSMLSLVGVVLVIHWHGDLPWLLCVFAGAPVVANTICLIWICLFHKPWMKPLPPRFAPEMVRDIFQTGSQFFVIQVAGLIVFNSDNLIISHYLDPAQVTPYNVTWRIVSYITAVPILVFPSLWPAYAEANTRGDLPWIRSAYVRTRTLTLAVLTAGCLVLLAAGRPIIRLWAGPAAVPDPGLLHLMCIWMFIFAITLNQSCLLAALNRMKLQAIFGSIAAIGNLTLSILLVRPFGPAGVLLATIVSYLVCVVLIQSIEVKKVLRGDHLKTPMNGTCNTTE